MAPFALKRSRRELTAGQSVRVGGVPSLGGAAVGAAITQAGAAIANIGATLLARDRQMTDDRAHVETNAAIAVYNQRLFDWKKTNGDTTTWEPRRLELEGELREVLALPQSKLQLGRNTNKLNALFQVTAAETYSAGLLQRQQDTGDALNMALGEAFATGNTKELNAADETSTMFRWLNHWGKRVDPAERRAMLSKIKAVSLEQQNDRLANGLVQTALGTTIVQKDGKDVMLPASLGLDLINAVDAPLSVKTRARTEFTTQYNIRQREAEKQTDAAQESDLLDFTKRIYSNVHISNEEIFASSLDAAQIKFIKTLQSAETRTKPGKGSPFANMEAMSINIQLGEGLITKKDAMARLLPLLEDVDPDRVEPLLADFTKKFGMARSNVFALAQKSSKTLISKIFADATTALEFEKLFLGASATDKAKLNRQFVAEWTNRNQYNVAFREWVEEHPDATLKEMSTAADFILLNYQKRQQLDLEAFEREIAIERNFRLRPPVAIPPQLKAIKDMSEEEKRAELLRLQQGR